MKRKTLFSTGMLATLCLTLSTTFAQAQNQVTPNDVPRTISYQGMITNSDGSPVLNGTYRITMSLYADPAGRTTIWQDTYDASITNGIFNIYLGSGKLPLPNSTAMNTPLWVGTQIGDAPEMSPLTPLSASPYALNVPDRAITTDKLADGAITAEKVSMDYIAGLQINDRQIVGSGRMLRLQGSDAIRLDYDEGTNSITIGAGNGMQKAASGDDEKGGSVLDVTDGSNNWLGRNAGANQPAFLTPVGSYNTLAGGESNTIGNGSDYSTIVGGYSNDIEVSSNYNFIGGGERNYIDGWQSVIAGGDSNTIIAASSAISGGSGNIITGNNSTIAGGGAWNTPNVIEGTSSFIGTGAGNTIESAYESAVVSGSGNSIGDNVSSSIIGSGVSNRVHDNASYNFIGSGWENQIMEDASYSAIAGGEDNTMSANHSFIGAGQNHYILATHSAIVAGNNQMISMYGAQNFIGAGTNNTISSTQETPTENSGIGAGFSNTISGVGEGFIGAGNSNEIMDNSTAGFVGAGMSNLIWPNSPMGAIAGGSNNNIYEGSDYSFIGGGSGNDIGVGFIGGADYATIGGGVSHTVPANYGTVGGGRENQAVGNTSTIPGGDNLKTSGYAQTAVGYFNKTRGNRIARLSAAQTALTNDPLFMVGNGDGTVSPAVASNAFEVSYNGHSVVYDVNGTSQIAVPGSRAPIRGATYVDNIIYAWGDINANATINSDFGVATVTNPAVGTFIVTIRAVDPQTGMPITLNNAAVVATLSAEGPTARCSTIMASRIGTPGPNQFQVMINGSSCEPTNLPFMFHLTGRP